MSKEAQEQYIQELQDAAVNWATSYKSAGSEFIYATHAFKAGANWQAHQSLPKANEGQRGWIDVQERLPKVNTPVLICDYDEFNEGNVMQGQYTVSANWYSAFKTRRGVKFWQPLPSPPLLI